MKVGVTVRVGQADQTSRFDRDSPGLECDVPVSRKGTFGCRKQNRWEQKASLVTFQFPVFIKRRP